MSVRDAARDGRPEMPYVDLLLRDLADGDAAAAAAFGRHIHWGYWDDPASADGTYEDFGAAAERMSRQLWEAAGVRDGMRVLDCGCGIGGTLASIDERCRQMQLVGLNIDGRQLAVARERVRAREGSTLELVEADACALPFPDASFDAVLAVECIFHFPSRMRFLREAHRVLRPGGRLAFSDFLVRPRGIPALLGVRLVSSLRYYGRQNRVPATLSGYAWMLGRAGLALRGYEDATPHTLPSYRVLRDRYERLGDRSAMRAGRKLEAVSRRGYAPYAIFSAERP
ncbi:MAG TPA: methyltransferase domain-containing protein [Conexibacter sp.]|nr:methyltransferase domain-containing protein [Conexibacter sp.]